MSRLRFDDQKAPDNEVRINTIDGRNPVDVHVGGRVKLRRVSAGMNEEELGAALGVTAGSVRAYERGEKRIGAVLLYEMCEVLECLPTVFFDKFRV